MDFATADKYPHDDQSDDLYHCISAASSCAPEISLYCQHMRWSFESHWCVLGAFAEWKLPSQTLPCSSITLQTRSLSVASTERYATLRYATLRYTTLYYTILHYTILHYTTFYYTILYYTTITTYTILWLYHITSHSQRATRDDKSGEPAADWRTGLRRWV